MASVVVLRIDEALRLFLAPHHRNGDVKVAYDGTSSLGHVVLSVGPPLTEVGSFIKDGRTVEPSLHLMDGDAVAVRPPTRSQRLAGWPRFVLDVHLGSLARLLRLFGLDAAYSTDATDEELIQIALGERRILLSKDRGLLRCRATRVGLRSQRAALMALRRSCQHAAPAAQRGRTTLTPTAAAHHRAAGKPWPALRRRQPTAEASQLRSTVAGWKPTKGRIRRRIGYGGRSTRYAASNLAPGLRHPAARTTPEEPPSCEVA